MNQSHSAAGGFFRELRRRGVFRVTALYIIAAWLIMQVADVFFPVWNIPEAALRPLLVAAILGFPIALVFGWMYDVSFDGIQRTPAADAGRLAPPAALRRADHLTLAALSVAAGLILYSVTGNILKTADEEGRPPSPLDKLPNSVAVLPFVNISGDAANEYFCDGISEEILHRLADYRDMHVLARTSSFAFKDSKLDVVRLAAILGVRYLLQGSVRKDKDQLRISAQLIDDSGFQIWSEVYDRKLSGVFAIQREIAAAVADGLAQTMSASHVETRGYTPNIEAYQHFLLGREYLRARIPGWPKNSIEHFDQAIAIDPSYPGPHAGRAIALILTGWDSLHYADRHEAAERSIDAALALDPELAIGHAARGLMLLSRRDYPVAEAALRKAIALDPNLIEARNWLASALTGQGLIIEGVVARENALARDPLNPILNINLGSHYAASGDFYRAETQYRRLLDLPKPPAGATSGLFFLYDSYGRYVDMIEAGKQRILAHAVPESEPHFYYAFLGSGYARLGMIETAEYWQERAEAVTPVDLGTMMRRSLLYRLQGQYAEMEQQFLRIIEIQGLDPERLPPWIVRVMGAIRIVTGDVDAGIERLESAFDFEAASGRGNFSRDLMQMLAYAHKQKGNNERTTEILEFVVEAIKADQESGFGRDPGTLALVAQNHAVAGNSDAAMDALEVAIASGWRDYFFAIHDARWDDLREDQRFQTLMAQVKADVDAQRARVEQIDAEEDFAVLLEQRMAQGAPD